MQIEACNIDNYVMEILKFTHLRKAISIGLEVQWCHWDQTLVQI